MFTKLSWLHHSKDNEIMNNGAYGVRLHISGNNQIIRNNIKNNLDGIILLGAIDTINKKIFFTYNNLIISNNITNNIRGINSSMLSINNKIFYNNFKDNTINAIDTSANIWYNPISKKGNYWDNYTGIDNNGDGIGDTPYNIPPWPFHNKDRYPSIGPIDAGNTEYLYNGINQINNN